MCALRKGRPTALLCHITAKCPISKSCSKIIPKSTQGKYERNIFAALTNHSARPCEYVIVRTARKSVPNFLTNLERPLGQRRNIMAKKIMLIALAASFMAAPTLASAQVYGQPNQRSGNAATGAVIGATVGAVAGSQIAGRGNRTDGSVLGAVVGAVVGAQIAKDSNDNRYNTGYQTPNRPAVVVAHDDRDYRDNRYGYGRDRDRDGYNDRDFRDTRYGPEYRYDRERGYGYGMYRSHQARYTPPMMNGHYGRGHHQRAQCGWGTVTYRMPNGRVINDQAYMCRQRDGDWVVVNR
jgi:surface antigen